MDKYEYRVRAEEINSLIEKKDFAGAVKVADEIDWRRVKSVSMLCKISDLYKIRRRYADSKDILLLAYEKLSDNSPWRRNIIYSLCELSIELEEIRDAVEYCKEFEAAAPGDPGRFILRYKLFESQEVNLEERIAVLEKYKHKEYKEKWGYELAYLYHRIGLGTKCVEECDELIVTFGTGRYVIKAMELKMLHEPLTPAQQEKYDQSKQRKIAATMAKMPVPQVDVSADTLPISIKSVEASDAPTMRIPAKTVEEEMQETKEIVSNTEPSVENPQIDEAVEPEHVEEPLQEELVETQEMISQPEQSPIPQQAEDDLDIQIKPVDFGEYATINLQQEIAKNLTNLLAEEDMEATDATKALPIETILDSTDPQLMKDITDDSIRNAIASPHMQDTQEMMRPITEEDLLASLTEKPLTVDELGEETEQPILRPQPLPDTVEAVTAEELLIENEEPEVETESVSESDSGDDLSEETIAQPDAVESTDEIVAAPAEEAVQLVEPAVTEQIEAEETEAIETEAPAITEPAVTEQIEAAETEAIEAEAPAITEPAVTEQIEAEEAETIETEAPVVTEPAMTEQIEAEETEAIEAEAPVVTEPAETEQIEAEETEAIEEEAPIVTEPVGAEAPVETPAATADEDEPQVEKQITGQLSFTDIMAEWEETKKAAEEKHNEEVRQRILKQTGPIFASIDATKKVHADESEFDFIQPAESVFDENDDLVTQVEDALLEDEKEEAKELLFDVPELNQEKEPETIPPEEEPAKTKVFNTTEIRGIEEKLLNSLTEQDEQKEPELVTPVIPNEEEPAEATQAEAVIAQSAETVVAEAEMSNVPQEAEAAETVQEMDAPSVAEEVTKEPAVASVMEDPEISVSEIEHTSPLAGIRTLTEEEKGIFESFVHTPDMEKQIAYAIDHDSVTMANGNLLITGGLGNGTFELAKNLIKQIQIKTPSFSGKVAKIQGSVLNGKDIEKTIETLDNGALIVEKAGEVSKETCEKILAYISQISVGKGIFLVFEDTRGNIDKLLETVPQLTQTFDVRIDMQALDNDALVAYGKEYANELEYAIDDMGMLALYTRIADLQTNDHHVSVDEVKEIVDQAIANANKKSVGHLMDVIFAKRYDTEDMIILREKDFMKDR